MPENEDIEVVGEVTEAATAESDSDYKAILAGEGTDPSSSVPAKESEEKINPPAETPDQSKQQPEVRDDDEVVVEIGGKSFTMKQSEALALFENASKLSEREKTLSEKEKSLNKDYTQKTQMIAGVRKSFEDNFGRVPANEEIQALGKVWKAYFENPAAQEAINQIIAGTFQGGQVAPATAGKQADPYIRQLETKIAQLEGRQNQFLSSIQEKETAKMQEEAQNQWKAWVDKKSQAKIQITDEIDAAMSPFVGAIRNAHPDWEAHRVLDEAYRHATIDTLQQDTAKKVLTSADEAKKRGSIKITPKAPQKSEKDMGYADLVKEAMSA